MSNFVDILEKVNTIRSRVAEAAVLSGRKPEDITLMVATKTQNPDTVRAVIRAGVDAVGENRVQELMEKQKEGAYEGVPLHFIGSLQSNKAKYIVGLCALIHSVDSLSLAAEIHRQAVKKGICQPVLVEVNIGLEESKGGVRPEDLKTFLEKLKDYPSLLVQGLMTIPPKAEKPEDSRPYFKRMKVLFEEAKSWEGYSGMTVLSMGMSEDYVVAVEEGSTLIRPGTAIFGPRVYTKT